MPVLFVAAQEKPCRSGLPDRPEHVTIIGTECAYYSGGRAVCAECLPLMEPEADPNACNRYARCADGKWVNAGTDAAPIIVCSFCRMKPEAPAPDNAAAIDAALSPELPAPVLVDPFTGQPDPDPLGGGGPVDTPDPLAQRAASTDVDKPLSTTVEPAPKAGRGRPRKWHVDGLDVEKRPGTDRWCVIHKATETPLILGVASKAKAQPVMMRLGEMRGVDWTADDFDHDGVREFVQNEQAHALGFPTYSEDIYRDHTASPLPDHSAEPGDAAGSAPVPVPGSAPGGGGGDEGAGRDEGQHQGGATGDRAGGGPGDGHAPGAPQAPEAGAGGADGPERQAAGGGVPGDRGAIPGDHRPMGIAGGLNGAATAIPGLTPAGADGGAPQHNGGPRIESGPGHVVTWAEGGGDDSGAGEPAAVGMVNADGPTITLGFRTLTLPAPIPGPGPVREAGDSGFGDAQIVMVDGTKPSLAAFAASAKAVSLAGNTPWAGAYAAELRNIVHRAAARNPRSLQRHLGPSEIGHECDRQVVFKLLGYAPTNHVVDPWPSILGTAQHAWFADAFKAENGELGRIRWVPEYRVDPYGTAGTPDDYTGTGDLYDADNAAVDDHKVLGPTSMALVRSPEGPPIYYQRQLKLYGRGFRRLGLPVHRVVLIAWPRTEATLDGLYCWEHVLTPEDDEELSYLFVMMGHRRQMAAAIERGEIGIMDVPAKPDPHDCFFCPLFRPQAAHDNGPGCPGHVKAEGD